MIWIPAALPLDPLGVTSLQFAYKLKSEPQNIECRMSNVEVKTSGNRLRDSIFLVRHSSFEWQFDCGPLPPWGMKRGGGAQRQGGQEDEEDTKAGFRFGLFDFAPGAGFLL
jgi:hypothetical protein